MTRLSVLDLSAVGLGGDPARAMRDTIETARAADRLGYHRFWVSEHHSIAGLASASPEVLIAALTQATQRIRLGSGGVMLVNYSPLKVAEVFMALEALAPGRIDLGIGRALGADPRTAGALRSAGSEAFAQYFALLNAWLLDASGKEPIPPGHPLHGISASPSGPGCPDLFLLCSSPETAAFAGRVGVGMVFAEFIARSDADAAIAAYRQAFSPSPFRQTPWAGAALFAFAAADATEAWRLDAPRRAAALATAQGAPRRFGDIDQALAFLEEHAGDPGLAAILARSVVGAPGEVRAQLERRMRASEADELFILATGPDLQSRIRCLELLAPGSDA